MNLPIPGVMPPENAYRNARGSVGFFAHEQSAAVALEVSGVGVQNNVGTTTTDMEDGSPLCISSVRVITPSGTGGTFRFRYSLSSIIAGNIVAGTFCNPTNLNNIATGFTIGQNVAAGARSIIGSSASANDWGTAYSAPITFKAGDGPLLFDFSASPIILPQNAVLSIVMSTVNVQAEASFVGYFLFPLTVTT